MIGFNFVGWYCPNKLPLQVAPPDHPKGTTWVWDDGSGVVLKADDVANEEREQRKAEQKEEVRVCCINCTKNSGCGCCYFGG